MTGAPQGFVHACCENHINVAERPHDDVYEVERDRRDGRLDDAVVLVGLVYLKENVYNEP